MIEQNFKIYKTKKINIVYFFRLWSQSIKYLIHFLNYQSNS